MKIKKVFRFIVLTLAMLTSPFGCVGVGSFVFSLTTGQTSGLFTAVTYIENQTDELIYITPMTTTHDEPRIIEQFFRFRYKNLPLRSGDTIRLSYDASDNSMDGMVLCREEDDCRYLQHERLGIQVIDDFDALPPVNESFLSAIDDDPEYHIVMLIMAGFTLTPFALFALWWRLGGVKSKK